MSLESLNGTCVALGSARALMHMPSVVSDRLMLTASVARSPAQRHSISHQGTESSGIHLYHVTVPFRLMLCATSLAALCNTNPHTALVCSDIMHLHCPHQQCKSAPAHQVTGVYLKALPARLCAEGLGCLQQGDSSLSKPDDCAGPPDGVHVSGLESHLLSGSSSAARCPQGPP